MLSDPEKDIQNQYTKRMEFLKGFLNTKAIVIYYLNYRKLKFVFYVTK